MNRFVVMPNSGAIYSAREDELQALGDAKEAAKNTGEAHGVYTLTMIAQVEVTVKTTARMETVKR